MKNYYNKIKNNKLKIEFTDEEIAALQQFIINGEYSLEDIQLENALHKIGEKVPTTNRGCLGKNIKSLLFN